MTTPAPITTAPPVAAPTGWLKTHERLIIIVIVAFVMYRAGQGIENMWIRHDDHIAAAATVKVVDDTATNKSVADQLAELKASDQAQTAALNSKLQDAVSALAKQQAQDSAATQQQILDRWKLLVPIKPGSIQSSGNTDTITPDAATQTVQALETIPVLESQVSDLNAKLLIDDGIIGKQDDLIVGLNKQIVDEKASHVADVNLEKAKARKSFLRGFKYGFVAGAAVVEAIRVWAGHP